MSSLSPKDRVSLCLFTFVDGRRCRTPRAPANPRFCFYHAQKEARAAAADLLATDLSYFFSGDYLSACDLSSALARIIPAVVQGHVKPRVARSVACLFQTLVQAVRLSQHEYINSFGADGWRQAIYNGVNSNSDYRYPPEPDNDPGDRVSTVAPQLTPPLASPEILVPTPAASPSSVAAELSPSPTPPLAQSPVHSATAPAPRPPQPSCGPVSAQQPALQTPSQTPPAQSSEVSPKPQPAPPNPQQPAARPTPPDSQQAAAECKPSPSPATPQMPIIAEPFRRRRRLSWGARQIL